MNFHVEEENVMEDSQFDDAKINHTSSFVEDRTVEEKKFVLRYETERVCFFIIIIMFFFL